MNENLFILNGVLAAMAAPTAETGDAATAEALPEAKIDENGKVTASPAESPEAKTDTKTEGTKSEGANAGDSGSSDKTASSAGDTSSAAGGEAADQKASDEKGAEAAGNDTAGASAGMNAGETADMAGGEAGMAGGAETGMAGGDAAGANMGMPGMDGMNTEIGASKPITQNLPVMIGITAGVLALSILAGIVLAKLKIKKGINLYED